MNRHVIIFFLAWSVFSCGKGGQDTSGKRLEEITIKNEGDIAQIIRNPVSAKGIGDTTQMARITFDETTFNFGKVNEGDIVRHTFRFVNSGKVPLVFNDVRSTCGCTVPEWPKEAIAPGDSGMIDVKFNTQNKPNFQSKPIILTANTYPGISKVYLEGEVVPAKVKQ